MSRCASVGVGNDSVHVDSVHGDDVDDVDVMDDIDLLGGIPALLTSSGSSSRVSIASAELV
jgi:hypothetical protein